MGILMVHAMVILIVVRDDNGNRVGLDNDDGERDLDGNLNGAYNGNHDGLNIMMAIAIVVV